MNKILLWVLVWSIPWLVYFVALFRKNINYMKKSHITASYFLIVDVFLIMMFRKNLSNLSINFYGPVILFIGLLLNLLIYFLSKKYLKKPDNLIKDDPHFHCLNFSYKYAFVKSFEVLFQEIAVFLLVLWLCDYGLSLNSIRLVLIVLFGLSHLGLISHHSKEFTFFFTLFSLIGSLILPYLILKVMNGAIISYLLHYYFYTAASLYFWLRTTYTQQA